MAEAGKQSEGLVDSSSEAHIYELGYHIAATVGDADLPQEVAALKGLIERHGGIFIMEEYPVLTPFAYPIDHVRAGKREKHTSAYFGWVKFELESRHAVRLKEDLDQAENLVRYLLITTVREDTRVPKRVLGKQEAGSKPQGRTGSEKPAEISQEQLDKSIAELVVE